MRKPRVPTLAEAAAAIEAHRAINCAVCTKAITSVEAPGCLTMRDLCREWREADTRDRAIRRAGNFGERSMR